jgi:cyclase
MKRSIWFCAAAGLILLAAVVLRAQQKDAVEEIGVLHVQGKVYMIHLPGDINITAQVGSQGILLVDSGPANMTEKLLAKLRQEFGNKPVRIIINTHLHPDHTGGNAAIQKAEMTARAARQGAAGGGGGGGGGGNNPAVRIIAHESTLNRMNGATDGETAAPDDALPTSTFFTEERELYFNGEPIEIFNQAGAHTDGDVMVFFRGSDVISAGDIFVTNSYPVIDTKRGGGIQRVLDGLNRILDLTIPEFNQQGGTRVIPGHGRLCNEADVDDYRNFMTIIRDRIIDLAEKGMTLEQIKARKPTLDFDGVFANSAWTPPMFIEAIYRDVSKK